MSQTKSRGVRPRNSERGGATLILVVILSTVIMTSISMSYIFIVDRAKYQARLKAAIKMQTVFEELARYILSAREQYIQVRCAGNTCGTVGLNSTLNYTATLPWMTGGEGAGWGASAYPVGLCWAPPAATTTMARWASGTATDLSRNTCFGVLYLDQFFCVAAPPGNNEATSGRFAEHTPEIEDYIRENYSPYSLPTKSNGHGLVAVLANFVQRAYAMGGINFGAQWAPPTGATAQLGIRPPSSGIGIDGGYGDVNCGISDAGGAVSRTCMTISTCPLINGLSLDGDDAGCVHNNTFSQLRVRFVSRESARIPDGAPAANCQGF